MWAFDWNHELMFIGLGGMPHLRGQLAQWKLARVARISNAAELQAAADAEGNMVPGSRGDAPARTESVSLGLKDKRSGLESLALKRSLIEARCGLRWTRSAGPLADCMAEGFGEAWNASW